MSVSVFYWFRTRLPDVVTIAGGPQGGRYAELAKGIEEELEQRLNITVHVRGTNGSLENLQQLATHQVDLALYQSGTQLILKGPPVRNEAQAQIRFVSNLYPEYLLPIGAPTQPPADLTAVKDRIWCCNDETSGDFAMTTLLRQHLGLEQPDTTVEFVPYSNLIEQLSSGKIDFGIVCCGLQAPILHQALQPGVATLVAVPAPEAMARKHASANLDVIPAGFFRTSPMIPSEDFQTVSLQAQLLADANAPVQLIQEVARIISDAEFQRRHGLMELYDGGRQYAIARPEYELHAGAAHVFHPELKPLINPDFVEGTEGIRSFLVSLIAAIWLLRRWWNKRQIRSQEHRLDRYIRDVLQLERQQMEVDGEGGPEESRVLQDMLDQVTILRQEALAEFTAHELLSLIHI